MVPRFAAIVSLSIVAFILPAAQSNAGIYFAINGVEGTPSSISLTNLSSTTFTVGIRSDDNFSGGNLLAHMGFQVIVNNPSIAQITNVSLTGTFSGTPTQTASGSFATVAATFAPANRPNIFFSNVTQFQTLATFTVQGTGNGSSTFSLKELTASPDDTDFTTTGDGSSFTGQDHAPAGASANGFSAGFNSTTGLAATSLGFTSSVSSVPEPGSLTLLGIGVATVVGFRRMRCTTKQLA